MFLDLKPGRYRTFEIKCIDSAADEVRKLEKSLGRTIMEDRSVDGITTIVSVISWSDFKQKNPKAVWF